MQVTNDTSSESKRQCTDANKTTRMIRVTTGTNETFHVSSAAFDMFTNMSGMIHEDEQDDEPVPLLQITDDDLFGRCVEFVEHHVLDPPITINYPLSSKDLKSLIGEWDFNFISKLDNLKTLQLIEMSMFLGLDALTSIGLVKTTIEVMTRGPADFLATVGITGHPTAAERLQISNKYNLLG